MIAHFLRPPSSRQRGAALVVALLLLVVLTTLALSGMTTASLELQMAGNEQYQKRAFQAADAAITRAIQAGVYDTGATIGSYAPSGDPAIPPSPVRGTGVRGCVQTIADDGSVAPTADCYEYFMRFDEQTGPTAVPDAGPSSGTELRAYHFVIDAWGSSGRSALSHHTQGFYVVGPEPPVPAPFCLAAEESCGTVLAQPPVRSYWRERGEG
jgi:type IV pilus assembly protein PilX